MDETRAGETAADETTPLLGACAIHPERPAMLSCVRCGNYACAECVGDGDEADGQCPPCRAREGDHPKFSWENIEVPWGRGYLTTAGGLLRAPSAGFDRSFRGDIGVAQRFAWLSALVGYLPLVVLFSLAMALLTLFGTSDPGRTGQAVGTMICAIPCALMLYPTFSFIYFTGMGLVLHALCSASSSKARFEQAGRAAYYGSAWELVSSVGFLVYFIPLIGPFIGLGLTLAGVLWRTVAFRAFAMRAYGMSPSGATAAGFFAAACWQILGFVVIGIIVSLAIFRRFG
jgi:hypothetical protein